MDPAELERLVDRELRMLPPPEAPRTLLPRVMAAVQTANGPWYSRAWLTWPIGWQVASVAVLFAVLAGVAVIGPRLQAAASTLPFVSSVRSDVADTARNVEVATTTVRVLWRALIAPIVPYAFGLVFLMSAACALFGTALNHLVFGKALR